MQMTNVMEQIKSFDWKKHEARLKELVQTKPVLVGLGLVRRLVETRWSSGGLNI